MKPKYISIYEYMDNYIKVKNCVESKQCLLLTSFDEFEKIRENVRRNYYQYVRIRFIGLCSHESSAVYTNFNKRNTGIKCNQCVKQNMKSELKCKNKNTNITELSGINLIIHLLESLYNIQRTFEGCKADLAIKLKSTTTDTWIPIQSKTVTSMSHGMYSCTLHGNTYNGMLIFIIAINDNKIWMIPGSLIDTTSRINISKRSKYNKYLVTHDIVHNKINEYMSYISMTNFDIINTPRIDSSRKELIYCNKRQQYISYLHQEQSILQGSSTDFTIGKYKIQEKVLGYNVSNNKLHCSIKRNNGIIDKIRKFRPYNIGDNDYYWLHSSIDDRFWIIPEAILSINGYIKSDQINKIKYTLIFGIEKYGTHMEWLREYEYNYKSHDMYKILELFK